MVNCTNINGAIEQISGNECLCEEGLQWNMQFQRCSSDLEYGIWILATTAILLEVIFLLFCIVYTYRCLMRYEQAAA